MTSFISQKIGVGGDIIAVTCFSLQAGGSQDSTSSKILTGSYHVIFARPTASAYRRPCRLVCPFFPPSHSGTDQSSTTRGRQSRPELADILNSSEWNLACYILIGCQDRSTRFCVQESEKVKFKTNLLIN